MEFQNVELWQVLIASYLRYFVFAGIAYLIFYVWKKREWFRFKIQQSLPKARAVRSELKFSLLTLLVFAAVIYSILFSPLRELTLIYTNFREWSVIWLVVSLPLVIFLHDTYFYWMHRLMHWKKIFPAVHRIHHRSHNPTPLAAFSFHPLEAILEIGFLPLLVFTLPVHRLVLGLFGLYMIVMNVWGHLGFELFPKRFTNTAAFRWFNTSTHHNMHHHYGRGNYGLYFNFWDRLMRTNHPNYQNEFESVAERAHTARKSKNILLNNAAVD